MTNEEIKKELEGCEVLSLSNEGTVYVENGKAFRDGEEITISSWHLLWEEYIEQELGSGRFDEL